MTSATILSNLSNGGHRITSARRAVTELMSKQTKPLSALDVHQLLEKKNISMNATTVYRELQFLTEQKILKTVQFHDGVQRYELSTLPHHHHLVCLSCNTVEDIEMNHELSSVEQTIAKTKKFAVERHSLEFYGQCAKCQ